MSRGHPCLLIVRKSFSTLSQTEASSCPQRQRTRIRRSARNLPIQILLRQRQITLVDGQTRPDKIRRENTRRQNIHPLQIIFGQCMIAVLNQQLGLLDQQAGIVWSPPQGLSRLSELFRQRAMAASNTTGQKETGQQQSDRREPGNYCLRNSDTHSELKKEPCSFGRTPAGSTHKILRNSFITGPTQSAPDRHENATNPACIAKVLHL